MTLVRALPRFALAILAIMSCGLARHSGVAEARHGRQVIQYNPASRQAEDNKDDEDDEDVESPAVITFVYLPIISKPDSETDDIASSGSVTLTGVVAHAFNHLTQTLRFVVSGTSFLTNTDISAIYLRRNETLVSIDERTITSNTLALENVLVDGRNDFLLLAKDTEARDLYLRQTIWAGDNSLLVSVFLPNGQPAHGATVTLKLADDQSTWVQGIASNGQIVFQTLPNTTILLDANSANTAFAQMGSTGNAGSISMTLSAPLPPSAIDNNDFSSGVSGWSIGTAQTLIVPHSEITLPVVPATTTAFAAATSTPDADMDLVLYTLDEGPQSISRSFKTTTGSKNIRVRYRFVTREVPGGYYGSRYNDYFSVSIRSRLGGGHAGSNNSMNGLGLAAFDPKGATAWREVSLPLSVEGDTVQVDATVANVVDSLYDSYVVIDFVAQEKLAIKADKESTCVNEDVAFEPIGSPDGTLQWSGGGTPASGSDNRFVTRFGQPGSKTVKAVLTGSTGTNMAQTTVAIKESSGASWVDQFPTSRSVADLSPAFRTQVNKFLSALGKAGAGASVSATYRPPERAYLMHYAWRISREGLAPSSVPLMQGVDICWMHYKADGTLDNAAAKSAASAMVQGYDIVFKPSLESRHIERLAIDMSISWGGNLNIQDAYGNTISINTTPRNGSNAQLQDVGASYSVYKLASDPPHWSSDGH